MLKLCPYNQYARKLCHIDVKVTWTVGHSLCSHFLSSAPKVQESRKSGNFTWDEGKETCGKPKHFEKRQALRLITYYMHCKFIVIYKKYNFLHNI